MTTDNKETKKIKLVTDNDSKRHVLPFPFDLTTCKRAFTTRHVDQKHMQTLISGAVKPKAGDLVLCQVTQLRQHCRLEQPNGRRSRMFIKDKIIVCYGNRYAPDQFESLVPKTLEACHLVAGGGIASLVRLKSPKVKPATEIQPLGLIGDQEGNVLNLKDYDVLDNSTPITNKATPIILVSGSSMNAGKTTTVASIIKGLTKDGYRVGAAKVTGTGSGGDLWHFIDAGAHTTIDFTDAGLATTYLVKNSQLVHQFSRMVNHLKAQLVDVIVIEVADGILQKETKALLESEKVQTMTSAMIYTSGDSSSALFGGNWLKYNGYNLLAISGVVSSNPLGSMEINNNTDVPVITKSDMTKAGFGHHLLDIIAGKIQVMSI